MFDSENDLNLKQDDNKWKFFLWKEYISWANRFWKLVLKHKKQKFRMLILEIRIKMIEILKGLGLIPGLFYIYW